MRKKRIKKTYLGYILLVTSLLVTGMFLAPEANSSINKQINYQGQLLDDNGDPVDDGTYSFTFRLYTVSSGGSSVWNTSKNISITNEGIFSSTLDVSSIDFTGSTYYLGVKVGSDSEMTPRKRVHAVPQAYNANNLVGDGYIDIDGGAQFGAGEYINFGSTSGTNGYGIRDNSGTLQYKNESGSWADLGSGGGAETDPVFSASPAVGITSGNITNWNTAYGWGDHSVEGYLTSYTETDPIYSADPASGITAGNITNWNTAYGWGNHSVEGYLTSYTETDPVYSVAPAAGITGTNITNWNTAYGWGDHSGAGYLTSYTETDPQVGSNTSSYVPRWNGSALVTGTIYDNGTNIGIGDTSPLSLFTVGNDGFQVNTSGQVGIGVPGTPGLDLQIGTITGANTKSVSLGGDVRIPAYASGVAYITAKDSHPAGSTIDLQLGTQSSGTNVNVMRLTSGGNVGIGTASPDQRLEVESGLANIGRIRVTGTSNTASSYSGVEIYGKGGVDTDFSGGIFTEEQTGDLSLWSDSKAITILNSNQYVGIGDDSPLSLFTVGAGDAFQVNNSGTITSGTWNGSVIGAAYGGTGLDTSSSTGVAQVSSGTWSIGALSHSSLTDGVISGTTYNHANIDTHIDDSSIHRTGSATSDWVSDTRSVPNPSGGEPVSYSAVGGSVGNNYGGESVCYIADDSRIVYGGESANTIIRTSGALSTVITSFGTNIYGCSQQTSTRWVAVSTGGSGSAYYPTIAIYDNDGVGQFGYVDVTNGTETVVSSNSAETNIDDLAITQNFIFIAWNGKIWIWSNESTPVYKGVITPGAYVGTKNGQGLGVFSYANDQILHVWRRSGTYYNYAHTKYDFDAGWSSPGDEAELFDYDRGTGGTSNAYPAIKRVAMLRGDNAGMYAVQWDVYNGFSPRTQYVDVWSGSGNTGDDLAVEQWNDSSDAGSVDGHPDGTLIANWSGYNASNLTLDVFSINGTNLADSAAEITRTSYAYGGGGNLANTAAFNSDTVVGSDGRYAFAYQNYGGTSYWVNSEAAGVTSLTLDENYLYTKIPYVGIGENLDITDPAFEPQYQFHVVGESYFDGDMEITGTLTYLALDNHLANTSNPHSVTSTQVGLGNVENTALSTWAGTSNITTLGTIGTGTWNGDIIGAAYGGTGIDTSSATGIAQVSSGTWSIGALSHTSLTDIGTNTHAQIDSHLALTDVHNESRWNDIDNSSGVVGEFQQIYNQSPTNVYVNNNYGMTHGFENGYTMAVYADGGGNYDVSTWDASGNIVSNQQNWASGTHSGISATNLSGGGGAVAWDAGDNNFHWRTVSDTTGALTGSQYDVTGLGDQDADMGICQLTNGNIVLAGGHDLTIRTIDNTEVYAPKAWSDATLLNGHYPTGLDVACLSDGSFMMAYRRDSNHMPYIVKISAAGAIQQGPTQYNGASADTTGRLAIAELSNGSVVIGFDQSSNNTQYVRVTNPTSWTHGSYVVAGTASANHPTGSYVGALDGGGFVVYQWNGTNFELQAYDNSAATTGTPLSLWSDAQATRGSLATTPTANGTVVLSANRTAAANDTLFVAYQPGGGATSEDLYTLAKTGIGVDIPTAMLHIVGSTADVASFRIASGIAPTSPNEGEVYNNSGTFYIYDGSAWQAVVGDTATQTLTNKTLTTPIITLNQSLTSPTTEGDIRWNASTDHIVVGTGSTTKTVMNVGDPARAGAMRVVTSTGETLTTSNYLVGIQGTQGEDIVVNLPQCTGNTDEGISYRIINLSNYHDDAIIRGYGGTEYIDSWTDYRLGGIWDSIDITCTNAGGSAKWVSNQNYGPEKYWMQDVIDDTDSPYTLTNNQHLLYVDATNNDVTVNLPTCAGAVAGGDAFIIKRADDASGGYTVTIDPYSTEQVDRASTLDIDNGYDHVELICDSAQWWSSNDIHDHSGVAQGGAIDHGSLSGRSDDDHFQYALLAGRTGGQTFIGSDTADELLTIQGNSASSGNTATSANLQFKVGDSGGTTAMTILNNGNIGIGTASPLYSLDVAGILRSYDLISSYLALSGNNSSILSAVSGFEGYVNLSGGLGSGNQLRLTKNGNIRNIGSIQAGEMNLTRGGTFGTKSDYTAGTNPNSVTSADFNGDGYNDIASSNYTTNNMSVFINDGDGTFAAKVDYTAGTGPSSIYAMDINGDGWADLVTANSGASTVSVFINDGDGTFAAKVDYAAGSGSNTVVVSDFDADGMPDIATTNTGASTFSILINEGDGTFAAKADYSTTVVSRFLTAADFDADGYSDIAVVNYSSNSASVFINDGDGTFSSKSDYTVGTGPYSLSTGDFNGDGAYDLAVVNYSVNNLSILMNDGDGTFAAKVDYSTGTQPSYVSAADYTGDGLADLSVVSANTNTVGVLINNGDGTFAAKVDYATATRPVSSVSSDFDNDGKSDIATANYNSANISVLLNQSSSMFYVQASTGNVGIGDSDPTNGGLVVAGGVTIGTDSADNLIDDASNGSGSTTLYIGQNTINTTAPSDIRLKHNIVGSGSMLDQLMQLSVVDFQYIPDFTTDQSVHHGLIAQEVESIYPYAVSVRSDGYKMINYDRFTPFLIKSVQEQQNLITYNESQNEQQDIIISDLNLQTSQNITTIQELQTSVDEQLGIIETMITSHELQIIDQNNAIDLLEDQIVTLQSQMDELERITTEELNLAQIDLNTQDLEYIKLILGTDRTVNPEDVHLLGDLEAEGVVAGVFRVRVKDAEAPTIGESEVSAVQVDENGDGIDDITLSDGRSVAVHSKAVTENSKIFVTFTGDLKGRSWYISRKVPGEYFVVALSEPTNEPITFDWWLVEKE